MNPAYEIGRRMQRHRAVIRASAESPVGLTWSRRRTQKRSCYRVSSEVLVRWINT